MEESLKEAVSIVDKYIENNIHNITYDLNAMIEPGKSIKTKNHLYKKVVNRMRRLDSALKAIEQLNMTIELPEVKIDN